MVYLWNNYSANANATSDALIRIHVYTGLKISLLVMTK